MNKYNNILRMIMGTVCASLVMSTSAQSTLTDYKDGKVSLGLGIVQSKLLSTAATQTILGEELKKTAAITLKDALYGRLLGLTALKQGGYSGTVGYGANMNIRGNQTTSENNMLILVDGIERNIDFLTVEEVESVTVLRDAAAVALLGYQGVNGALLVQTKRGTNQKMRISAGYDHKFTFSPQFAEFVDAYTYAQAINKARANDGLTAMYNNYELDAFKNGTDPYYYPNVNWKEEAFRNLGSEDRLYLSMKGGNEKLQYYTLMDYTDTRGMLQTDKNVGYTQQLRYSKANIRANFDAQLTSTTKMRVNVLGTFFENTRPNGADEHGLTWMVYQTPASAFPVKNNPWGELAGVWGGNTTYGMNNVVAQIQGSGFLKSHGRQLQADVALTQDLSGWIKGLSVSGRLGYNNYSQIYESNALGYMYGYQKYIFDTAGKPIDITSYSAGNLTDNLEFSHYINQHNRSSYLSLSADYKTSFCEDDNFAASLIWHQKNSTANGQFNTFNRMNVAAYLHYDLRQKYMADLVLAFNGSNRAYPQKWAFSPTLSLGYILTNNEESKLVNLAKLRMSVGIQHSDFVPKQGLWLESYNGGGGDYYFGAGAGSALWGKFLAYQRNSDFKLETAYKFNMGADIRLAKQFDITFDAYYNLRDNILQTADGFNSTVSGLPSAYLNWGRVASYGVELGANWVKQATEDFAYNIGMNFTWGRNEVLRTVENVAYGYLSSVGARVNQAWGLEAIGFFKDEADIASSPQQNFDTCRPGDLKYRDQNGDNIIDEDDVVKMGYDTAIPQLNYSLNLGFRYKDFGLNMLLQGAGMYTAYLGTTGVWMPLVDGANLSTEYYDNSWDIQGDQAQYPRLTSRTNLNNYRASNIWYKNINFLKLRNCEFYYYLPSTLISKVRMSECKFYVKGENLFTLSNMKIMDPEQLGTAYPTLMGVSLGVAVKF